MRNNLKGKPLVMVVMVTKEGNSLMTLMRRKLMKHLRLSSHKMEDRDTPTVKVTTKKTKNHLSQHQTCGTRDCSHQTCGRRRH